MFSLGGLESRNHSPSILSLTIDLGSLDSTLRNVAVALTPSIVSQKFTHEFFFAQPVGIFDFCALLQDVLVVFQSSLIFYSTLFYTGFDFMLVNVSERKSLWQVASIFRVFKFYSIFLVIIFCVVHKFLFKKKYKNKFKKIFVIFSKEVGYSRFDSQQKTNGDSPQNQPHFQFFFNLLKKILLSINC